MSESDFAKLVRKAFVYRADGTLVWRNPPRQHARLKGLVAGSPEPTKGYIAIQFMGKKYRRHKLVWLYHHDRFPRPVGDHINRDRRDDRIENLRELAVAENNRNHSRISVRTTASGRFQARLAQKVIGTFDTFEQAKEAYINERRKQWSN